MTGREPNSRARDHVANQGEVAERPRRAEGAGAGNKLVALLDPRLLACVAASVVVHAGIARALEELPERVQPVPDAPITIAVNVVEPPKPPPPPPPEPEPPKPPEPEVVKPPPRPVPLEPPKPQPVVAAKKVEPVPVDTPPPTTPPPPNAETTTQQKFGVNMSSTSTQSSGPPVAVGNTTRVEPNTGSGSAAPPKPLAEPAAAAEVTKMPLPKGRCAGKYTEAAKQNSVEGVVVLDLVVDANGAARDIVVVQGLPDGLSEAAIAALQACPFSPGERGGVAVPVRIRGFKIRFILDAQ